LHHYCCQSLNLVKNDSSAIREVIHCKQISPPKSRWGESWLFRFNVCEEFKAMNFKPLCNLVCRKPTIDDARAYCTHVHDQLLLLSEVHDEISHYWEEAFFNHLVHDVLHDKVKLMRSTPNMKERIILMHRILKLGHNMNDTPNHILSSVKWQTKKANLPIRTTIKKLDTISNMTSLVCH